MLSGSCSEAEVAAIVEAVPNLLDPQVGEDFPSEMLFYHTFLTVRTLVWAPPQVLMQSLDNLRRWFVNQDPIEVSRRGGRGAAEQRCGVGGWMGSKRTAI